MSRKTLALVLGAIVVVIVAVVLLVQNGLSSSEPADTSSQTSAPSETINPNSSGNPAGSTGTNAGTPTGAKTYTMSEVATHNSASSCWTAINGNVYNVTSWISQHPGGAQAILSLCGKDGSAMFNDQHGGQRRPESELATFKIGALAK